MMTPLITATMRITAAIAIALAPAGGVLAQAWPQRPVKIIVPYAAGGNTDAIARLTAERLTSVLGQQFIVENRAGAGGAIAAEYVAKSPADGYTLFVAALSQFGPVPLTQKVGYDPLKDFAPISNIGANAFVIAVGNNVPVATLKEFVDYVRARPDTLNYSSGGTGSLTHLAGALFLNQAGIKMLHVPYKGGAPALADLLGGQVQMYTGSPSELIGHARSGKLKLLGISSAKRNPQLPDVPAIAELYPKFSALTWNGLLAPAATPAAVVERVSQEMLKAMRDQAFLERLAKIAVDPVVTTPAEFSASIRADYPMWRDVIK